MKQGSMAAAPHERVAFLFDEYAKGRPYNIKVQDAAALTGLSVSTLNAMRLTGDGPRFMRIGRSIRYKLADVIRWMDHPTFASTSEADEYAKSQSRAAAEV